MCICKNGDGPYGPARRFRERGRRRRSNILSLNGSVLPADRDPSVADSPQDPPTDREPPVADSPRDLPTDSAQPVADSPPHATDILDTTDAGPAVIRSSLLRIGGYGIGTLATVASSAVVIRHLGLVNTGHFTTVTALVT